MIRNTSARPIAPATILLSSAFSPMDADCTEDSTSVRDTGSAPPLMRAASSVAFSLDMPPPLLVISQDSLSMVSSHVGAVSIFSSSQMTTDLESTLFPSSSCTVGVTCPDEALSVASANFF